MNHWFAIFLMAGVTYLIRALPLTLIRKEIHSKTLRSFLYYVPYVTLTVMIFPAILDATAIRLAAVLALLIAVILAWRGHKLFTVAAAACLTVFIVELFF